MIYHCFKILIFIIILFHKPLEKALLLQNELEKNKNTKGTGLNIKKSIRFEEEN